MAPLLLSLKNVTVMRGDHPALREVNLEVAAGEHVCILGPNGCGKSTLIKTITRECYPLAPSENQKDGCAISILGRERWNIFELRSQLGIVSPDLLASCTTDATGRDVVLSGFFSSTRIFPHHHPDPEHLARTQAALERLGIAHLADRPVAQMSSGEAKRTLIARALVHHPQTLLLDEPSNALDIREILRFFKKRINEHGSQLQIDVFGEVGLAPSMHIGQDISVFAPEIDKVCPMVYPSHYEPYQEHALKPYETIYTSLMGMKRQMGNQQVPILAYIELFNFRQVLAAFSRSLKTMVRHAVREPLLRVLSCRRRTVANVLSMGLVVRR